MTSATTDLTPNRRMVAIITLACFAAAGSMWWFGYSAQNALLFAGLIRVGIFMSAVWLALPARGRLAAWRGLSPWMLATLAIVVFLIPRLKYSIPLVVGMLLLGTFIRPKKRGKSRDRKAIRSQPQRSNDEAQP